MTAVPLQANQYFAVRIEQDGQEIPIRNHQVTLAKRAFTIVIYFAQPDGILVNASFSPESFDAARAGRPLQEIPGFSELGMAEDAFNSQVLLITSSQAPHYWYYQSDANHRFNQVIRQDNLIICRRIVGQVLYRDSSQRFVPMKEIVEQALYLVFMKTRWTQDFSQQVEQQRDYLKILFK